MARRLDGKPIFRRGGPPKKKNATLDKTPAGRGGRGKPLPRVWRVWRVWGFGGPPSDLHASRPKASADLRPIENRVSV